MAGFFDDYTENETFESLDEAYEVLQEKSIVKMDNKSMKKRLFRRSTLEAARRAKDPLFAKYIKHTKYRKMYRRQIEEKYASKARAIVKGWLAARK